ncbi:hypothetical protein PTTG_30172 [Puccinia triticina 1-1 BBBD Race 1]|uniref:DNA 3'-5' helicase n=1 Tax=Puccinia triticina (isolate 1-1 / race 1 (BBBD)) TaxID=630390 RepID=A0A180G285_PUCT1|nr:hypothetical protein PTTG_30172 [Puccinia triticina 1-1 BBBD Race 1]
MTFTRKVADKIIKGDYSFVYLSPEVFLNNGLFNYVFYKKQFQDRLALVVVDEAHMIYLWGLVAKGKSKRSSSHARTQDRGIFRPSYGNLGARLMATYGVPVLLQSATCRPIAIKSIMKSLKITNDNIDFVRGELTRPEIQIIRMPMKSSLTSANDLLNVFGTKDKVSEQNIPPTLIYSGTQNATLKVMKVVNQARGNPRCEYNPHSPIIRRYHAASGEKEKKEAVDLFNAEEFPCMSCTMALGLGQNWKRVRRVIHMGRGDPSTISQMIGRAGRDGRTGLAILFMERHRKFGKNRVEDFTGEDDQEDDCRMDALAVTPVCLRIAISVDNINGCIPVSFGDPSYLAEKKCEVMKFPVCRCSNCLPEEAEVLARNWKRMTVDNWDNALKNPLDTFGETTKKKVGERNPLYSDLKVILVKKFNTYFEENLKDCASFMPDRIFGERHAEKVVESLDNISSIQDLSNVLGGESLDGLLDLLYGIIIEFRKSSEFQAYLTNEKQYNKDIENNMDWLNREIAARATEQKKLETEASERANQKRKRTELLKGDEIARKKKKFEDDQRCLEIFKRAAHNPSEENERARLECLNEPQDVSRYQSSRDHALEPSLEPSAPSISPSPEMSPKSKPP